MRTATVCQRRAHFLNCLPAATERIGADSARSRGRALHWAARAEIAKKERKEEKESREEAGRCRIKTERDENGNAGRRERKLPG